MARSQRTDWPGNVRELENMIERAVGAVALADHSCRDVTSRRQSERGADAAAVAELEAESRVDRARDVTPSARCLAWNKKDAAELMGLSQRAMSYYLHKHRIEGIDE